MSDRHDSGKAPDPKELAAYRDGELSAADRPRVEEWLATHPDAAAEVHALERLHALWQSAGPPEPAEAEWALVFGKIERGFAPARGQRAPSGSRRRIWLAVTTGAAAAVIVLTVTLSRWHTPGVDEPANVAPFLVASNEDVEIVSIDAGGVAALVVGELPLRNPIVLMEPGDIALTSVARGREGTFPEVRLQADTDAAPMILGPGAAGLDTLPLP